MPKYQYQCTECGEALEVQQSFTDEALTECPACEGRLRKVYNAVGVVFKGSGFYRTDSRAGGTSDNGSGGSSSGSSESKSSGSSDSSSSDSSSSGSSTSASSNSSSAPAKKSGSDSAA